jgi:hypothetical protein
MHTYTTVLRTIDPSEFKKLVNPAIEKIVPLKSALSSLLDQDSK